MSNKDNPRCIPDGAHHSGLMKDYGGTYNPDYTDPQTKHPYCQVCGWRKGGVDSWDGKSCKCGDWEPALPQHGIEAIKASVAQTTKRQDD